MNTHTSHQTKWLRFSLPVVFVVTWFISFGVFPWPAFSQGLPTGCAEGGDFESSTSGFDSGTVDMENVLLTSPNNTIKLDTGANALSPNNIVIPFKQDVSAVYLSEGMLNKETDLGWFLVGNAYDNGDPATGTLDLEGMWNNPARESQVHWLFHNISDDQENSGYTNGDGVLDEIYDNAGNQVYSGNTGGLTEADLTGWGFQVNNDGIVDNRDMRKYMGNFAAGTEIVFVSHSHWHNDDDTGYNYTKDGWSTDVDLTSPDPSHIWKPGLDNDKFGAGSPRTFIQRLLLEVEAYESNNNSGPPVAYLPFDCENDNNVDCEQAIEGLLPIQTIDRLNTLFNTVMAGTLTHSYFFEEQWNPWVVAAPPADPFKWILGVENLEDGGNADFNDILFLLERQTGGVAALKSANALTPSDPNANITKVSISVHDIMPCTGDTRIDYEISIDDGVNWVDITNADWNVIKTPDKAGINVTGWVYGSPAETYREATIDFQGSGMVGNKLLWRSTLMSTNDACKPEVISLDISFKATLNARFSRSSPAILGNVMYSGSFETPASTWIDLELRGHEESDQIYDPSAPAAGFTGVPNWPQGGNNGAGWVLKNDGASGRLLYTPKTNLTTEVAKNIGNGNNNKTNFTGTLSFPILRSSLTISDGVEIFRTTALNTLVGSLGGFGTINHYTGAFSVTFATAPSAGSKVKADYTHYTLAASVDFFSATDVTEENLTLDQSTITDANGTRFVHDLDNDGDVDDADALWLKRWVKGFRDGVNTEKEWFLSAIDHSTTVVVGAPGLIPWYYGTAARKPAKADIKAKYDAYMCNNVDRPTAAYVGSKMGMLHSFAAGEFRPYYFDKAQFNGGVTPPTCDWSDAVMMKSFRDSLNPPKCNDTLGNSTYPGLNGTCAPPNAGSQIINNGYYEHTAGTPDYGTGAENWAFIPADLAPKLKNNYFRNSDQAAVDASPAAAHVYFQTLGQWRTILISAEGNGGDHLFALDITDPTVPPQFLWEYGDHELFRSYSSPSIATIAPLAGDQWVAFFVSGLNNDSTVYPSVYAVDVETGALLQKISLNTEATGKGGTASGQPTVADSDGDGYSDVMYIGTDKGFVYKIDITEGVGGAIYTVCTFANLGQPIQASPAVVVKNEDHPTEGWIGNIVLVGTGDSAYYEDSLPNAQYYFYALNDEYTKAIDNPNPSSCALGSELWKKTLSTGHRVFASAFATANTVFFGTTTADTDDPCAPSTDGSGDTGSLFALDLVTGDGTETTNFGNVVSAPVGDDGHVYTRTTTADSDTVVSDDGSGDGFQKKKGKPSRSSGGIQSWKEITQ